MSASSSIHTENSDASDPLVPAKYRFFPGWTMLGVSATAQFLSAPGQSYSVAAFKDPMRSDLGISETNYSLAYGFATLVSGLALPWIGRLVDRFGARRILPIIAMSLGGACLSMAWIGSLPGLYVGFSLVRCLGQGALTLVAMWIVGEWFMRRRGMATAVAGLGGSLSVMCFPLLNRWVIAEFGWQTAWMVLAAAVWLGLILPAVFLLRDRPEDLGLHPDGIEPEPLPTVGARDSAVSGTAPSTLRAEHLPTQECWTLDQVLRDTTFWKLLSVSATAGMVVTGLTFHQVALLGSRGVSPAWALGLISLQAMIATTTSLPAGWLTDRLASRYLLATSMLLLAVASIVVLWMPVPQLAIFYAALLGLFGSIVRSTGNVVWVNYYGRTHQGSVRGVAMSAMILAAAVGPLPVALSIDWTGSYTAALLVFIAVPLLACLLVWTARPVPRPTK